MKARDKSKPVKLLQWNIERGYKLPQIIEELKALDADVLALQEVSQQEAFLGALPSRMARGARVRQART